MKKPYKRGGRQITIRVTAGLWMRVLQAAYDKRQTVSDFVRHAVIVALREKKK